MALVRLTATHAKRANNQITLLELSHVFANFHDFPKDLVAHDVSNALIMPSVVMQVGA